MHPILILLLIGLCFGGWPLIAKSTNLSLGWMSLAVATGTAIAACFPAFGREHVPPRNAIFIGLAAGVVNGLGMLFYSHLIGSGTAEVSRFMPVVTLFTMVVGVAGGLFLFHEPMTTKKMLGVGLAFVAA